MNYGGIFLGRELLSLLESSSSSSSPGTATTGSNHKMGQPPLLTATPPNARMDSHQKILTPIH
jgi:hypothetical protein